MAVVALLVLAVMLTTQDAVAMGATLQGGSLPSLSGLVRWFTSGPLHWGNVPVQSSGTAAGHGHAASAASTRAGRGVGHAPGRGPGELPVYAPYARPVKTGPSRAVTGFSAKTSRRDAAKSSAVSDYYVNADGSITRKVALAPINYADGSKGWQPIDTGVGKASDGRWHEKANSLTVDFAPAAADGKLVSFATDGSHGVSYGLQGAAAVAGQASGSTVTYRGVLPGTDIAVEPTGTGVKESLVLHSAQAGNSWVFPLDLKGLKAVAGTEGAIDLVDGSGKMVEEIPPAYAFDSKVDRRSGDPATTHAVSYALQTVGGKSALVVTLDPAWLHSPDRVFPVTVDPTMNDGWTTTYAESSNPGDHSSEQTIKVGSYDSGTHSANSFINHWYTSLDGSGVTVTAASLTLFDTWASTCTAERFDVAPITSAWTPSGVTAYPGPSFGSSIGNLTPNVPDACANTAANRSVGDWVTVPLSTSTFQGWANGTTADNGLAAYASTTDNLHWKQFGSFNDPGYQPYLTLTYSGEVPPQIYQQYPSSGAVVGSTTPEFSALGFSPAGSSLQYDFQVYNTSGTKVADSGLISTGDWIAPANALAWNQTYYWTVQAYDGTAYSAAPPWSAVTVSVKQPVITSGLSQNGGGHGFDPSIGNYTTSDTDADISGAGPALQVVRDYNSRDPRWSGSFGAGWSSVFDAKVTEEYSPSGSVTGVVITYPDGSEVGFGKNPDGSFSAPSGRFATVKSVTGGYTLTDKNDTVYTFTQSLGSGAYGITSVADANGRSLNFTWTSGQVTTMTSATSGRSLHLTWSTPTGAAAAHVATIYSDPVTGIDQNTDLTWKYSYTGDQLASVCQPLDYTHCTGYVYTAGSQYQNAAMDLDPHSFWSMAEASGTTANSSVLVNEGSDNATYSNVTLGQAGPLTGSSATAAGFNGTSSSVLLPNSLANKTDAESVSMWFKTSTAAGVLFSYNSQPMDAGSLAGYYTPSIYIGSDGKLNAEFWYSGGAANPIVSPTSVADGQWHHVVLSAAGNSQTLFLDGAAVGSASGQVSVSPGVYAEDQDYTLFGAGYLGGLWPDEPHYSTSSNTGYATFFNGSIADAAFFTHPLVAADVTALYNAGTHSAALLSSMTRPSGKAFASVTYDPVSAAVTKVTDNNGGSWSLAAPTVTGSSQVYRSSVMGSAPHGYWRLGDTAGASVAADEVNYGPATYNAVTLGASGPFTDATAAHFDGSSSYVQLPAATATVTTGPNSVEMWFNMPAGNSAGGVLFGEEKCAITNNPVGCGGYDPALYVGTDGKLYGKFWDSNGTSNQIITSNAVNDGKWHHVVLAASTNAQVMYLDGVQAGTTSGTLSATGTGYTYVGAGAAGGNWTNHPTNTLGYFPGSIAEAAFYNTQLSAQDAASHYEAAKNSKGLLPVETVHVTDPGNATLTYQYDPLHGNREIAQTDALGHATTYGYDTGGFEHTVTDPNGNVTTTGHDPRGNTVSVISCQNQAANACSTEYFSYYPDDTSAQLTTADPRNDLLLTRRDGRSSSASDNTYLTSFGYDAYGNSTSTTTPPVAGFPAGRTTTTTYSDGTSTYPAADSGNVPAGLPVKTTSPSGAVNTVSYLHNGDVASTTDADGLVTNYTYDGIGRVLSKTVVSDTYPSGLTTSYVYDQNSEVTQQTDPVVTDRVTGAQHTPVTTTVYDADGNVTSQTVADSTGGDASRTESSTYNQYDQLAGQEDANGNAGALNGGTTTYSYDAYGNKVQEAAPDGTTTAYGYDADGHLLTQTLKSYTGDPVNPSTAQDLVESSRAYDPAGRLASITDSMGNVTSYTYTDDGLVATITKKDSSGANSFQVQANQYDAAGNLTQRTTNNGLTVTQYQVDAASRTTSTAVDPSGVDRVTQVSYTPDDLVASTNEHDSSGWDRVTTDTYDPMGHVTAQTLYGDASGHPSGWWKLDQTSGTTVTDSSGTGNTASVSGAVTWGNSAATFTGTSGQQIATGGPVVNTASSFTVSGWVNLASLTSDQTIASAFGTNVTSFSLGYSASHQAWVANMAASDSDSASAMWIYAPNNSATANTWAQVALVYDSATSTATLYVNGSQAATGTQTTPWAASGAFAIGTGRYNAAPTNVLNGQAANVQAYPRALSAGEISTVYSSGRSGGTVGSSNQQTTNWTYDKRGLPTSTTDANGNTTSYAYDEAGNLAVSTAPTVPVETGGGSPVNSHPVTTTGYNTFGEAVEQTDPNGSESLTGYDADGNKVSQTLPSYTPPGSQTAITAMTTWAYNNVGNVTSKKLPDGETTGYLYDQMGDLAQTTAPDTSTIHTTYDTNGDALSATDGTGAQSQSTYDWLGRKLTDTTLERFPSTQTLTTHYSYAASSSNPDGAFLASVTSPAGRSTSYGYDNIGEKNAVTDAAGNTTRFSYDFMGDRQKTTLPDGTASEVDYNMSQQPAAQKQFDAAGNLLTQSSAYYDGLGNLLSATDANGHTTTYTYDATGTLSQEVQPVSATHSVTTSFGYDAAGNRTRYTDGRNNNWITTYNSWNLPETQVEPATATYTTAADSTTTYAYNGDGQLTNATQPGGAAVAMGYDSMGNLTSQSGSGADAATATRNFSYDANGRVLTAATTTAGTAGNADYQAATNESFSYNDRGSLLGASGSAGSSSFVYDGDSLMTSRTDAAGTTSYTYDNNGRLATLADPATGTNLSYTYNSLSQPATIQYGSTGQTRTFSYNSLHQLTGDSLTQGTSTLASITYGYDNNGNLTSKNTAGVAGAANNTYGYDWANRLTSWNNGTATTNYGYDDAGNRVQIGSNVYTYDARDQLTSDGTNSYTYTARGTLSQQTSTAGTINFSSDAYGQQITAGTQSYGLDAAGRVMTDTTQGGGGTRTLQYSGADNLVAGDASYQYTYDPTGSLIGINTAGAPSTTTGRLALTDQHTDVIGTFTPGTTTLTGSATYDPLGNTTASANPFGLLGYQSGWTDSATGKVNMAARWYNPAVGQFMNKDTASINPVPNEAAANPFAYVGDNPMIGTDPTGHCSVWDLVCDAKSAYHAVKRVVKKAVKKVVKKVVQVYHKAVNVVRRVVRAVHRAASRAIHYVRDVYRYTVHYIHRAYHYISRAYHYVANHVRRIYHRAVHYIKTAYHYVKHAARHLIRAAGRVVRSAYHATVKAVKTAATFVKHHAAAIASFAISTAVFAGCEAAVTAGSVGTLSAPGLIGCSALAGAVGGLVDQGFKCASGGSCSVTSFAKAAVVGGALGGLTAGAGVLGGKALRALAPKALEAVGGLFRSGATDAADSAASESGASAADEAGVEAESATSCPIVPHSFSGTTRVLMADGTTKAIDQIKVGDKIANSVPGLAGTQTHTVQKVIVTHTDHDFVDVTIAAGTQTAKNTATMASTAATSSATTPLTSRVLKKAALGLAASLAAITTALGISHHTTTQRLNTTPIAAVSSTATADVTTHGSTLTTTFHHPFYDQTQAAFVDADHLHIGDLLQTPTGTAQITALRLYHANTTTYDLTINGLHTYYVLAGTTPILVHNCNGATLDLKYKKSWTPDQIAAADKKVAALNSADRLVVTAVDRSGSAADMWRAAGKKTVDGSDIDHVIELQLGGADDVSNMTPLDSSVNRSIGAQISAQMKKQGLQPGDLVCKITISPRC